MGREEELASLERSAVWLERVKVASIVGRGRFGEGGKMFTSNLCCI